MILYFLSSHLTFHFYKYDANTQKVDIKSF